ncbi:MAG: hypothetical protein AAB310_01880, partial [Nitrospirota bacterium]
MSYELRNKKRKSLLKKLFIIFFLLFTVYYSLFTVHCYSEVVDRVVAIVDDEAIMLSELNSAYQRAFSLQGESA